MKGHPALTALFGLLLLFSGGARSESLQAKLSSPALAAGHAGLAGPTIAIDSPTPGQPYVIGEKATVTWHFSGIKRKKKLTVLLMTAGGKVIRRKSIRADRSYSFRVNQPLAQKLRLVRVCIRKSARFAKVCDTREVTVLSGLASNPSKPPDLVFKSGAVGFVTLENVEPPAQSVPVDTTDHQAATFSVVHSAPWLSVTPTSGSAPGTINLGAHVVGMTPGTYKTVLTASASGNLKTFELPVTLEVRSLRTPSAEAPATLAFSAAKLGFTIESGDPSQSQRVNLFSDNGAATTFQAASNVPWLTLVADSGKTPAGVTLTANASGLSPGTYKGEVTAKADGYGQVKLPVTLTVATPPPPRLLFSASEVGFALTSGNSPSPQSVDLSVDTGAAVAFTIQDQVPWLTLLPTGSTTPSRITLAVNGAGMLPGTYTAGLTATAGGFEPVTIPVRLTVGAAAENLLSDDFADGDAGGWTIVNDVAGASPDWQVTEGELRLLNLVGLAVDAVKQGHNIGSYAVRDDSIALQDYQFDVKATPTSEFNVDIGVMFRYRDPSNYFRVSIGNGFTRLEKRVDGTFSTLAGNARGYIRGVPQYISVSVQGGLIQVSVNGERLFSVRDESIPTGGIALYCRDDCAFDDVGVRPVPASPTIAVSKPEAHTLVTNTSFDVYAAVLNHPDANASVEFSLTGIPGACGQAVETSPGVYAARCSIPGDGTVGDVVAGLRVGDTIVDMDSSERVAYGNQIIAIGDSITFGYADDDTQDNQDPDGWVISAGYEPMLTKLLNQTGAIPSMVYNDAVPGIRSNELAFVHLDGILLRHPDAQYVLLTVGTNDAGTNVPESTYQSNMQKIVNKIRAAGKTPVVALIPPRFGGEAAKNGLIAGDGSHVGYNNIIPLLTDPKTQPSPVTLGPNFYADLLNRADLFADELHPNGAGYGVMAELWNHSLGFMQ